MDRKNRYGRLTGFKGKASYNAAKNDLQKKNAEGYSDPTAYEAIKKADEDRKRFQKVLGCILRVCEISGFEIDGRITLVDTRTGKVWD